MDPTPETLVSAWGNWPIFVGLAVALFVRAWQVLRPVVWDDVPSRYRPLIGLLVAGLPALSLSLLGGASWAVAVLSLVQAWGASATLAEALRLALGKPGSGES